MTIRFDDQLHGNKPSGAADPGGPTSPAPRWFGGPEDGPRWFGGLRETERPVGGKHAENEPVG
jgi:hypothetical protein